MKKVLALVMLLLLAFSMTACANSSPIQDKKEDGNSGSSKEQTAKNELVIFAAASLQETLDEIKGAYEKTTPNVKLILNFDSSGTLKKQIEEGAYCDIFISASPKQLDALDASCDGEKNPDGLDLVLEGTRINLLENKVVLAVPEGNPKGLKSYEDLAAALKNGDIFMAMGNTDVPVGQYTQKILDHFELDEEMLAKSGCITYGSNVKEVTTQISEASVDCGIIYQTDAFSSGLETVATADKEMCGQVIYPAAVLKISEHPEEAKIFLNFLTEETADAIFSSVGFSPLA